MVLFPVEILINYTSLKSNIVVLKLTLLTILIFIFQNAPNDWDRNIYVHKVVINP